MSRILKIIAPADLTPHPACGRYVKDYSPHGNGGLGRLIVTNDIAEARVFDDIHAALRFWRSVSSTHPIRPDGKPNRPLTAFTVEVMPL